MPKWKSRYELAEALRARAAIGRNLTVSPATARLIATLIVDAHQRVGSRSAWDVDLYAQGSCVLEMGRDGNVNRIVAWARSTSVARAARAKLRALYPQDRFEQRRGGWIESSPDDRHDRLMSLTLDLPEDVMEAIRLHAVTRNISMEVVAIEILILHLQGVGAIDGELVGPPSLRLVKPEGNA